MAPLDPGTQRGGEVKWEDPVTLTIERGSSLLELVRGGSGNLKLLGGLSLLLVVSFDDVKP